MDLEGSDLDLIEVSSRHLTDGGEERQMTKAPTNLSQDARILAEIRTEYLHNTSIQHYLQLNLLGKS
jgi:hypothetical protein